jgi:hypothetical protein
VPTSQEERGLLVSREFCIVAPDFSLSVASDCPDTLSLVQRYLLPWLPRVSEPRQDVGLRFSLTRNSMPGCFPEKFEVQLNDRVIAESEALPYLFTLLQQAVDERMIRNLQRETAVHAGVVAYRSKAILLAGPSGSGKSRLVQELLRQGAEYCSDEYAILDTLGNVRPYPRALMIRKDGEEQHPVLASDFGAKVRTGPAPVALILFLRYQPDAPGLDIAPLDRSEALIRLLQNTPQVLAEKPDVIEPLRAAISRAVSFAGVRGDAGETATEILRLAEHAAERA